MEVNEAVFELSCPLVQGHDTVDSLQLTYEELLSKDACWEPRMVGFLATEAPAPYRAAVNIDVHWCSVVFMYDKDAIGEWQKMMEPGKVLLEFS